MESKKIIAALLAAAMSFSLFQAPGSLKKLSGSAAEKYTLGDVNGDGSIDAADASLVLSEYALLSTKQPPSFSDEQRLAGDVDSNESIDSADASLILAYYSYLSTGGTDSFRTFIDGQSTPPAVTTTAKPVSTTKPVATTAKPVATTAKPVATTAKPVATTAKPVATTAKPVATTAKPVSTTAKPVATTAKPVATTAKPVATTAKPVATTAKPVTTTKKPVTTTIPVTTTAPITTAPAVTLSPDRVSGIRLSKTELNLVVREGGLAAYVTMLPATAVDKSELWTSSDENVAVVDEEGWVTAVGEGECIITVQSVDNPDVKGEVKVTVTDIYTVRDIRLSRTSVSVQLGSGTLAAEVTMLPTTALDKEEIWSSSDESIAYTDDQGWIYTVSPGTCIITVQSHNNPEVKAEIMVTVYEEGQTTAPPVTTEPPTTTTTTAPDRVTEIHLSLTEITLEVGGKGISYVTMLPAEAPNKNELWTSSDERIAIVDGQGTITALREGKCTITVKSEDNPEVKAEITVTVVDPNRVTAVELTDYELVIPLGKLGISYVTFYPEAAPNKGEIWVCSDESIASVDKDGWIYGRRLGECTVTVYSADNSDVSAEIKVKVVDPESVEEPTNSKCSIDKENTDTSKLTLVIPLPAEVSGRFVLDYVITDANGVKKTVSSSTLILPAMSHARASLTADTPEFDLVIFVTDLSTGDRSRLGVYRCDLSRSKFTAETEDIPGAFGVAE